MTFKNAFFLWKYGSNTFVLKSYTNPLCKRVQNNNMEGPTLVNSRVAKNITSVTLMVMFS